MLRFGELRYARYVVRQGQVGKDQERVAVVVNRDGGGYWLVEPVARIFLEWGQWTLPTRLDSGEGI